MLWETFGAGVRGNSEQYYSDSQTSQSIKGYFQDERTDLAHGAQRRRIL